LDWKLQWIIIPPYYKNGKKMEQMMGRLIAMMEQITAKVEANTNAW
jgi:hypothetical protein